MKIEDKAYKSRSEKIIFRVKPEMKEFIKEFASKQGLDISDFMRLILEYFCMAYFTGQEPYQELKKRFYAMFPNDNDEQKKKI